MHVLYILLTNYYCRSHHVRANPYSNLWIIALASFDNRISIYYEEKDCRGSCRNRMLNFDNFEDRYYRDVCIYLLLKEEERRNYSNWVLNFDNLANGLLDVRVIC